MEIILSKQCESLTGSLGSGFGYHIQKRKNGFFAQRDSKGSIPPDGHLRFIFACADLARSKLHITDIRVSAKEFRQACNKADRCYGDELVKAKDTHIYNAYEIVCFKMRWNL